MRRFSFGRQIHASLKRDRADCALNAGKEIEAELASGRLKEAWGIAKRWYQQASDTPPKPCYKSLEKQTEERVELYGKQEPPGDDIPINVGPYPINDGVPTNDSELRGIVRRSLKNGRVRMAQRYGFGGKGRRGL